MSNLEVGIVGLPNVGKSTLFNAITKAGAEAANYPFCTIEPNVGIVDVPDKRLQVLHEMYNSKKTTPAAFRFVDIAGLVKGASKGEGLGNKFLEHIRQVDAVAQVVRCFEDGDITHVEGSIDPIRDIEIINTELCLADMEVLERRMQKLVKLAKSGAKEAKAEQAVLDKIKAALDEGNADNSPNSLSSYMITVPSQYFAILPSTSELNTILSYLSEYISINCFIIDSSSSDITPSSNIPVNIMSN